MTAAIGGIIRVVLADANLMSCRLLSEALEQCQEIQVVACVVDNENLLQAVQRLQPDIALISVHLEEGPSAGLARLHELRSGFPDLRWVVLLDYSDPRLVVDAFRAGARGVFSRSQTDVSLLYKCIRCVAQGQVWADNQQMHHVLQALTQAPAGSKVPLRRGLSLLTPREEEVVRLVAQGHGNREIAQLLGLTENTVKNHLFRIFEKLGLSSRVEVVLWAVARENELPPGPLPSLLSSEGPTGFDAKNETRGRVRSASTD